MTKTKIEWCDEVWNPIRGCTAVSEGCRNCYAAAMASRFSGPGQAYDGLAERTAKGPRWTGKVRFIEEHVGDPLRWTKPRKVFVNSMSDLFHPALPSVKVARIWATMAACYEKRKAHVFQVLTKRPERARDLLTSSSFRLTVEVFVKEIMGRTDLPDDEVPEITWPLPNVWLGTSVEDQAAADARIPALLAAPAAIRFLSCEPLLGPVSLKIIPSEPDGSGICRNALCIDDDGERHVDWVIVGGESGPGARPMDLAWARSLRDQCQEAGVAYFMKQRGAVGATESKKGGALKDIPEDLWIREFPTLPVTAP